MDNICKRNRRRWCSLSFGTVAVRSVRLPHMRLAMHAIYQYGTVTAMQFTDFILLEVA
jgi:hypothetical protein